MSTPAMTSREAKTRRAVLSAGRFEDAYIREMVQAHQKTQAAEGLRGDLGAMRFNSAGRPET